MSRYTPPASPLRIMLGSEHESGRERGGLSSIGRASDCGFDGSALCFERESGIENRRIMISARRPVDVARYTEPDGKRGCLDAMVDPELALDVRDVDARRLAADIQRFGDLPI